MRKHFFVLLIGAVMSAATICGQSPVVVPAATSVGVPKATAAGADDSNSAALLKSLQDIKAANDDMLQKQAATLALLDEMEKNAEELRIFARRT
ncbi:MAG: hypothetical protein M3Z64_06455 [Verrucomicrobiota bacterium]|nr:hypothetical protein [Verrucomicrobiota bacterium]